MSKNKGKQKNHKKNSPITELKNKFQNEKIYFKWDLCGLAFDFPENAKDNLTQKLLIDNIIPVLQKCEGKEWKKIENQPHNYFLSIATENGDSMQEKWIENNKPEYKDYITEIFCFSIGDKKWLLGIKQGAVFKVLWYDEGNHSYLPKKFDKGRKYFEWDISTIDWEFPDGIKEKLSKQTLINKITNTLQQHEDKTWNHIKDMKTNRGKKIYKKHKPLPISNSKNPATIKRWQNLNLDKEIGEEIFSFYLNTTGRLYGYVKGVTFYIIWYDHNHVIYPSPKKHT